MNNVINLSNYKKEKEWERVGRFLEELEKELNSITPTEEDLAEDEIILNQIKAIECLAKAKVLLLRALLNPEKGNLSFNEVKLKSNLESDKSIIYCLDPEFWDNHINIFKRKPAKKLIEYMKLHKT